MRWEDRNGWVSGERVRKSATEQMKCEEPLMTDEAIVLVMNISRREEALFF